MHVPAIESEQRSDANGLAVASFVTGLLALILFWGGWLFVAAAGAAIVMGMQGMKKARQGFGLGGLATAGFTLGILAAVFEIILLFSVGIP